MEKDHTHPDIITFVELGLQQWFINQDFNWTHGSPIFTTCPTINTAFQRQLQVGWYYFLCGMITKDLVTVQQHHYTTTSLYNNTFTEAGEQIGNKCLNQDMGNFTLYMETQV